MPLASFEPGAIGTGRPVLRKNGFLRILGIEGYHASAEGSEHLQSGKISRRFDRHRSFVIDEKLGDQVDSFWEPDKMSTCFGEQAKPSSRLFR